MSENGRKIMTGVIALLVFAVCLTLVVTGQRDIGPQGLLRMLLGLAGLVGLLWYYNRQYR